MTHIPHNAGRLNVQYCKPVVKQNQTNIKNRLQVHRFRLELGYIIKWAIWATWHYRVHKCIPEYTNVCVFICSVINDHHIYLEKPQNAFCAVFKWLID